MKTKMMMVLSSSKGQTILKVAAVAMTIVALVAPGTALADGPIAGF